MALPPAIKMSIECAGLAGKAGGLRTAALVVRGGLERGLSMSSLAKALEDAADRIDGEAAALLLKVEENVDGRLS